MRRGPGVDGDDAVPSETAGSVRGEGPDHRTGPSERGTTSRGAARAWAPRRLLRTATLGLQPDDSYWPYSVLTHWPRRRREAEPLAAAGPVPLYISRSVRVIRYESTD